MTQDLTKAVISEPNNNNQIPQRAYEGIFHWAQALVTLHQRRRRVLLDNFVILNRRVQNMF